MKHTPSIEAIRKFMESDEGKAHMEEYFSKIRAEQDRLDARIIRFHDKYQNDIDGVMKRLIKKYSTKKYRNKEHKLGYEPREYLLWFMLEYARVYATECNEEKYWNQFTGGAWYLGSFVLQIMFGQGSCLRIDKIEKK